MIKILSTSVPDNQPLTSQETKTAVSIFDFINKCFESLGLGIGPAELRVIKHPNRGCPQFCPLSRNPEFPCDTIYLSMDSFKFWCQLIFQASHEFTHCVIHRLNSREEQKVSWIEETICEAISLVFLDTFANNWSRCTLSKNDPSYAGGHSPALPHEPDLRGSLSAPIQHRPAGGQQTEKKNPGKENRYGPQTG